VFEQELFMEKSFILETNDLERDFGGIKAVRGVTFRLHQGELRCLIGPNGAGKSTFFKLVTGQLHPTSGTILFDGREISRLPPHSIGRLGIAIKNQVPSIYDGLSVRENLWIAARSRHSMPSATRLANELIERLQMTESASQTVGTLAHGQRQWVEIGMVMAQQPRLVLLDEPTAGMAADEIARTVSLIRELNRDASVIVVEHDMQFVRQLDAVVTVFVQGQILVEDRMDVVLRNARVRAVYLGSTEDA
jgi:branched-chain amino acid transport system ATP-binding protein/urea transport system ATP-binding protein